MNSNIVVTDTELNQEQIKNLFDRKIDVLRIENYIDPQICNKMALKLRSSNFYGHYENAPKIARVGQAFFECKSSESAKERYRKNSTKWITSIREDMRPYLSPIDKLRLELDEIWEHGANLAVIDGMKLFAGLARELKEKSSIEPHQDILSWDLDTNHDCEISNQLATNTYLDTSEDGGDILLWDKWLSQEEYEKFRIDGSYGVSYKYIGEPTIRITPKIGELILFNSERVHAVEHINSKDRLAWSCFIGYKATDASLKIWS